MKNLKGAMRVIGFIIKINLFILLALITCTCSGPRLMLGHQSLGKQIDYSLYSGKLAKQIPDVMECAISKTDALDLASWHQLKLLTGLQYQAMHDSAYCPNLVGTQKKCSQIKWYQYR